MNKKINLIIIGSVLTFLGAQSTYAAAPPALRESVAVCDPNAPLNCTGGATSTDASGTVATGGTFQSVLAANGNRKGCTIQNPTTASEVLYVYFGPNASATTANSFSLAAGAAVSCAISGIILDDNVSVTGATTGHAFTVKYQ